MERAETNRATANAHDEEACVSVVVPSYNHARFVEQTLRSVFAQTERPRELIVIDDGSKDESARVVGRVLRDCPFPCELIARPNRGLCATLNEGFARASAPFFAYLGSDDVWLPGFLAARTAVLRARPRAVLAYGHAYTVDERNRIVDCSADWARYRDGDARRMLMEMLAPLSPTVVYRRDALARHRWNERARLEDYEMYLRLSADGEFAFDPRVLSAWRWHGRNASDDIELMLGERLAAQARVGPRLGFGPRALAGFADLARFRSAEEFIRRGRKRRAVSLVVRHPRGVPSTAAWLRTALKLLAPARAVRWKRQRERERAFARYGMLGS